MKKTVVLKHQFIIIIVLIVLLQNGLAYATEKVPEIKAASAIVVESSRGQVLYEKESKSKLHISSANKIMTALLALEKAKEKLDTMVTISKNAAAVEGSILNLEIGGKYTVEDLVYTIIIGSANDSANALAEYVSGDIESFVELMNNKAKKINMVNTHFTNPTGLYNEGQYTTANDIAVLIKYALGNPEFHQIFSSKAWSLSWGEPSIIVNSNELFWRYDGVDGGKTGYNDIGRHTAITTVTRDNQQLICVVLDSPVEYEDSAKLLDYGFESFRVGILVSKGQSLKRVMIGDKSVDLVSINDVYYTYPVGENYIKDFRATEKEGLKPPLTTGDIAGTAKYILKDDTEIEINLYPDTDIYSKVSMLSSLVEKLREYRDITVLFFILVLIELLLVLYKLFRIIRNVLYRLINHFKQ